MCGPNAAAKSSSVPNPHLYNCTIASRVHPLSPDCPRIYGCPSTSTWVSPLPSTTWTDLAGSHPGKSRSSIAQAVSGQAHIRKRPGRKPTRNYFKLSPARRKESVELIISSQDELESSPLNSIVQLYRLIPHDLTNTAEHAGQIAMFRLC